MTPQQRPIVLAAAAALALGIAGILSRAFTTLEGTAATLVMGGSIGLVVVGIQQLWRIVPAAGARVGLVALIPALFVSSIYLGLPRTPGTDQARRFTLPGYRVDLPPWRGEAGKNYWFDALRLDDPSGNGRFIEVRWSAGPPDPESAVSLVQQLTRSKVVAREPARVAGKPTEVVYLEELAGSKAFAFTPFDCNDGRSAFLLTFLNMAKEPLLKLHRQSVATITCADDPHPERAYPKVQLPADFTMAEQTSGRTYAAPAHDQLYFFSSGVPGPAFAKDFAANEQLRREVVAAEFAATSVELLPGASLGDRPLWSGRVSQVDGGSGRVSATAFHCATTDESFFAYHYDLRPDLDGKALEALLGARCP